MVPAGRRGAADGVLMGQVPRPLDEGDLTEVVERQRDGGTDRGRSRRGGMTGAAPDPATSLSLAGVALVPVHPEWCLKRAPRSNGRPEGERRVSLRVLRSDALTHI